MKIVAISNQKGGVGKTTTAVNLAAALAETGARILLVDLDPQGNATSALGIEQRPGLSLYGPLTGSGTAASMICESGRRNLALIPAHMELAGSEIDLARTQDHLQRLRTLLEPLDTGAYDYIILDTPPSLGVLMTSALGAADEVIVPLQCEYFGLEGLAKIFHVVDQIRTSGANPKVQIEGIVMTMFDPRTNLARQVVADVRKHFEEVVYETIIPRSVRMGEAPSFGKPITEYEPGGRGAQAYRAMAAEFLARHAPSSSLPVEKAV